MEFTTRPELAGTFGMVASTHWLASAVGMKLLEAGGRLGLHHEPALRLRVGREVVAEDFERDVALEAGIEGPVDDAHPAGAETIAEFVLLEGGRAERRRLHRS